MEAAVPTSMDRQAGQPVERSRNVFLAEAGGGQLACQHFRLRAGLGKIIFEEEDEDVEHGWVLAE